jgi:hypothetical protein
VQQALRVEGNVLSIMTHQWTFYFQIRDAEASYCRQYNRKRIEKFSKALDSCQLSLKQIRLAHFCLRSYSVATDTDSVCAAQEILNARVTQTIDG